MLPAVWLPIAADEFEDAVRYYRKIQPRLADHFYKAVTESLRIMRQAPLLFPLVEQDCRRAAVQRFPYSLFFKVEDERLVVIACFHGRRDPARWQGLSLA